MRELIARQLYKPSLVLLMLSLMQLMVTLDFNMAQVTLVALVKSARYMRRKLRCKWRGFLRVACS
ncbi:hypothetical protein [Undibacterium terreum]|uniref:Uncharacterized protein n=1 Tax=Undibacterium terreum TaxID=1224302 RepID=A0A916V0K7_9BURK|nr:hypothetical protein [Undibacterium terreum]GGC97973.1 hypothetical protein GCM10011396_51870 [Undibacterium terreum]